MTPPRKTKQLSIIDKQVVGALRRCAHCADHEAKILDLLDLVGSQAKEIRILRAMNNDLRSDMKKLSCRLDKIEALDAGR